MKSCMEIIRSSYASFPINVNANMVVVFEATTSQINFKKDTLCDLDKADWQMTKLMRTVIYRDPSISQDGLFALYRHGDRIDHSGRLCHK